MKEWMNETLSRGKILITAQYQEVDAVYELINEWKNKWRNELINLWMNETLSRGKILLSGAHYIKK